MAENKKFTTLTRLVSIVKKQKSKRKKIVFTNGCFDILHLGHIKYLQQAKTLGDILIIGLNSDASVRKIKGKNRPINSQYIRAEQLAALSCVDFIIVFKDPTPYRLIDTLKPNVLVKGGDWKKKDIVGSDIVERLGGKVKTISYIKGLSTTELIKRIRKT